MKLSNKGNQHYFHISISNAILLQGRRVPQNMRDAKIVTLFINKGDPNYCNNYRRISLLSIVGKIFARVVLTRIQVLDKRAYPESQCGFRPGKSTIDNFL